MQHNGFARSKVFSFRSLLQTHCNYKQERVQVRVSTSAIKADKPEDKLVSKPKIGFREVFGLAWVLLGSRRGLFLSGLLLLFVNRACGLAMPASARFIIDNIIGLHEVSKVPLIIALLIGSSALQALSAWGMAQILSKGGQRMIADLRIRIQSHMGFLPLSFYDRSRTGEHVSRIMSDLDGIRNLLGSGVADLFGSLTTALLAFAILFSISLRIALMVAALMAVYVFCLLKLLRAIWPVSIERVQAVAEVTGRLTESLGGIRVVKGFDAESYEQARFALGIKKVLSILVRAITIEGKLTVLSQLTASFLGIGVVYLGVNLLLAKQLSLGGYLTCSLLMAFVMSPLMTAVTAGLQLTEAGVGIKRALNILDERREQDNPDRIQELGPIKGRIAFENVSFSYDESKPVLHNISFVAEPSQIVALVGPSGAGKSTVANLICGFYSSDEGKVTIDGVDLKTVRLASFRGQLGVVFQDTFLFQGTIRENVAFANPDATEDQIHMACRDAHVGEFAERFPDKYETLVGERGVRLSGGQKQRVSIARALLANPRILILDEATSNLDLESEQLIQTALATLMRNRTTIVIAHRLSTIQRADQIIVLDKGRIIESGTHDRLYSFDSRYRRLYDMAYSTQNNRRHSDARST